jgi:hypothetical protein
LKDLGAFLEGFALPLVLGGEVHVGRPIAVVELDRWVLELVGHPHLLVAIDEHRAVVAGGLVIRPPTFTFDENELRLCGALYNLLVLQNPGARGYTVRPRMRERVRDTALALASMPPPTTRREILARHALLSRLPHLARTDVRLSWWTGRADFHGQRPPRRLLAWPGLRQVRVDREVVPGSELFAEADGENVAQALYAASPLTSLFEPTRRIPVFSFSDTAPILRDAELARAVAYRWTGEGPSPTRVALQAAAVGPAWMRLVEEGTPADVRTVTAFLVHVCALLALAEVGGRDLDVPSELLRDVLGQAEVSSPTDGITTLLSLPDVAAAAAPALAIPPGLGRDSRLFRRWTAHRAQVRAAVPAERVRELARRLQSVLGSADSARISSEP